VSKTSSKKKPIRDRKPKPIFCCICKTVFGSGEEHVSYVHHNGDRVDLCYNHIFSVVNQPGTYFAKLPTKQERRFDLIKYLNATRKTLAKKSMQDKKVHATLSVIYDIMESTKLANYFVNGMSDFLEKGLQVSKYPEPETAKNIAA